MFGNYSMLISILFFGGLAITLEWILASSRLKRHLKLFLAIAIVSLIFCPLGLEWFPIEPKKWDYGVDTTFYTTFLGTEVELYLLSLMSYIAISSAVVILTDKEDRGESFLKRFIGEKIVK